MNDVNDVSRKVVFLTGASSGIGLHLCGMLLNRGATVIATARSAETNKALLHLAEESTRLVIMNMDVSKAETVASAAHRVSSQCGRVDVLINNAGVSILDDVMSMENQAWDTVISTNLTGPMNVCRSVIPLMSAGGSIINISSIAAHRAIRSLSAYSASKLGLEQWSRVLALEVARQGIRVNVVVPGYIRTAMNDRFLASDTALKIKRGIPTGRFGEPEDLDGVVLLLASDASKYMTGACLTVDGGFLL